MVALLGPRHVGKTTLARQVADGWAGAVHWYDLERAADVTRLADPELALGPLRGLVVLDEVHRRPEIFSALRVLADRPRRPATFLVLGSASETLLRQSSESLAGRITFYELGPMRLEELGLRRLDLLWLRGGLPRAIAARSDAESWQWRTDFIRTFLGRDLPDFGVRIPAVTLERFWAMLSHVHGQTLNWSELGRSLGASDHTVRHYVDVLSQTYMVRCLQPWFENISKRQVKAPKLYVRDSGLLHRLLDIESTERLQRHPGVGGSWEGFVLENLIDHLRADPARCFFWATHKGAELDLLVLRGEQRFGFEVKYTTAPSLTPSMRIALEDLKLERLDVIHAGKETYSLHARVRAVAVRRLLQDITPLSREA